MSWRAASTMSIFPRWSLCELLVTVEALKNLNKLRCENIHPLEGTDLSNLQGLGLHGLGDLRGSSNNLAGVESVGMESPGGEGVAREGDVGGACCRGLSTGSDSGPLNGAGSGENARDGRSHQGSVETLHVDDWN